MVEHRIHLTAAAERNCHPPLMFGRFRGDELIWVLSSDGRSWTRQLHESAECFEARIVRDLVESAHAGSEAAVLVG